MLLIQEMESRHEMFFITGTDGDAEEHAEGKHTRVLLSMPRHPMFWHHYRNAKMVRGLRTALARIRPDVVHFHSILNRTFSAASTAVSKDYPTVWSLHDVWSQCVWSKPRPPECRGMITGCTWCPQMPGLSLVNRWIKEHYWAQADLHVILCTEWMRQFLAASALGRKPIHVIPNGVDLGRFDRADHSRVRSLLHIPADARVVLFAGNMQLPQKGHVELLRVARRIVERQGDTWFVLVGHHFETNTGHPHVIIIGPTAPDEMADYHAAADVFAFPSHVEYAPLVIVEAMASGVPQVACRVGGIPEQVVDGKTGFLIDKGDQADLERKLLLLLDDAALRKSMGLASRRRASELFTIQRQASATEAVYAQVIAEREGGR
jgi:glycosyltransferase involved in cell wall biosynthesis